MPNIKSAKKRVIVNNKKAEQNKNIRSAVKSAIKKVDVLVKENKLEDAKIALNEAFRIIDSASSKNVLHANNASNKKAKLAKKVAGVKAGEVKEEVEVQVKEETPVQEEKKVTRKPRAKKAEAAE